MPEIPPPIFTDCAPDCNGTMTTPIGSGACAGRYPWTIQVRADPSWEALGAPSVGRPIFMRLWEASPTDPVPGECKCWNGTFQGFVRYGPCTQWAGDIIYLPSEPTPKYYTMEAKQGVICGVNAFCYSVSVVCTIQVGIFDRTSARLGLENIRYRVFREDPLGFDE